MKNTILFLICFVRLIPCESQNIGIGTTQPNGKLQINNNSNNRFSLLLMDSGLNSTSSVRFQNYLSPKGITLKGFNTNSFNSGASFSIQNDSLSIATFNGNGRIGINNTNPKEAIDVNGNINLSGTIKTNGNSGLPGQLLSQGNNNQLQWTNSVTEDDNKMVFTAAGSGVVQTFVIPSGVAKITIEMWGGGGTGGAVSGFVGAPGFYGGGAAGGGGGGGYLLATVDVTTGQTVSIIVGQGATSSQIAESSIVTIGAFTLKALPGTNAQILSTGGIFNYFVSGIGGLYLVSGGSFRNFSFQKGADGELPIYKAYQVSTGVFVDDYVWGKGGPAGNGTQSNGIGGQSVGLGLPYHYAQGTAGAVPGGGGGGDRNRINSGGDGMVVVNY